MFCFDSAWLLGGVRLSVEWRRRVGLPRRQKRVDNTGFWLGLLKRSVYWLIKIINITSLTMLLLLLPYILSHYFPSSFSFDFDFHSIKQWKILKTSDIINWLFTWHNESITAINAKWKVQRNPIKKLRGYPVRLRGIVNVKGLTLVLSASLHSSLIARLPTFHTQAKGSIPNFYLQKSKSKFCKSTKTNCFCNSYCFHKFLIYWQGLIIHKD